MKTVDFKIDVSDAAGLEEDAEISVSLHLPGKIPVDGLLELLVCVHGGGCRRSYWHPAFASSDYSFAEHLTASGRAVLAVDLLGMGESTQPDPETKLSRAKVAAANHYATRLVVQGLIDGHWARAGR